MDIFDLIGAIFAGTTLTCAFIWGMGQAMKVTDPRDMPWLAYAATILPLVFLLLVFLSTGQLPPHLDALTTR